MNKAIALLALAGLATCSAVADSNYFGYSYATDMTPVGHFEVYQWVTGRIGRETGRYQVYDLETEIEYGFSPTWAGSLYVTQKYANINNAGDAGNRDRFSIDGMQFSVKHQLKSVENDGYGLGLYVEPAVRTLGRHGQEQDEYELETKILFEKHFIPNELIYVTNLVFEPEWERENGSTHVGRELKLNWSHGITYRVVPGVFLGAEADLRNASDDWKLGDKELSHTALFAGPCAHYISQGGFWSTLTVLPQIHAWPSPNDGRDLDEFTKLEVRLKVGYNF